MARRSDAGTPHGPQPTIETGEDSASDELATVSVSIPRQQLADVATGSTIGRFVIHEQIGSGGMGQVYRAYDPQLDRSVALKLLRHRTNNHGRLRLAREAQAMAALNHPNIVPIFDVGEVTMKGSRRVMFIAMQLIEGQTLSQWCRRRRRTLGEILAVFRAVGEGLGAAHEAGLVHRDFKPSNVMIDEQGRAKVLDFGLARAVSPRTGDRPSASGSASMSDSNSMLSDSMTMTGLVVGTPAYMAPEQHEGGELDHRCDQYAFCTTLWEAIYGRRPFDGDDMLTLHRAKYYSRPVTSARPAVPRALRRALERGLAVEPDARFASMAALLRRLDEARPSRSRWVLAAGAGGAIALAATIYGQGVAIEPPHCQGAQAKLEGIWDAPTQSSIETSIERTGLAYAPDTWQRVERLMDDYAARWVSAHTRACMATTVERTHSAVVMDQRMRCLDDRLGHLAALSQTLVTADDMVVQQATRAISHLPTPEACDNVDYVSRRHPVPSNPTIRDEVAKLRVTLRKAWALNSSGHYAEGLEMVRELERRVATIDYPPVQAEALLLTGVLRQRLGQFDESADSLRQAYFEAKSQGLDELAARSALELVYVVGQDQGKTDEALDVWAKHAIAAIDISDDQDWRASLLNTVGILHRNRGDHEQALEYHREALAAAGESKNVELLSNSTVKALNGIGLTLTAQGKYDQAIGYMERVLAAQRTRQGPLHPLTGGAITNIGMVYSKRGDYEQAFKYQQQALSIYQQSLEPEHPDIINTLYNMAITHTRRGDYESSLKYHLKVLPKFEAIYGPEHSYTGDSLYSIGMVYGQKGDYTLSAEYHSRALAVFEESLGPDHAFVADALTGIGNARLGLGDAPAAIEPLERAAAILEQAKAAPEAAASVHFSLAQALAQGLAGEDRDPQRALELGRRAREEYASAQGRHSERVAKVDAWLAEQSK